MEGGMIRRREGQNLIKSFMLPWFWNLITYT